MASGRLDQTLLTPRRWALLAAGAIFVLGFGALSALSAFGFGEQGLRGLYSYRSATIGDGLLLPMLGYSLVRAGGFHRGVGRHHAAIILVAGALGAIGGAVLQAQWLINGSPRLNWTLPRAHHFNLPGWWHAGFLVSTLAFLAAAGAALILRVRQETSVAPELAESRIRSVGVFGLVFPALGFVALLAVDNSTVGRVDPMALGVSTIAAALLVVVLFGVALQWTLLRWNAAATAVGLLSAVCLALLFPADTPIRSLVVLATLSTALAGVFASSVVTANTFSDRILIGVLLAVSASGPVYATATDLPVSLLRLGIAWLIGFALVVIQLLLLRALHADSHRTARSVLTALGMAPVAAFGLVGWYVSENRSASSAYVNVIGVVAGMFFAAVASRAVRIQFDPVIKAEEAGSAAGELSAVKSRAYLAITAAYSSALLTCIVFVAGTTPAGAWTDGSTAGRRDDVAVLVAAVAVAVATRIASSAGSARVFRCAIVAILCGGWSAAMIIVVVHQRYADWRQATASAFVACVVALFVIEGVISNAGYLQNLRVGAFEWAIAITSGLASGTTILWLTGPGSASGAGVVPVGIGVLNLVVAAGLSTHLPMFAARALPGAFPPRRYTISGPLPGVWQDGFIATILAISAGWVPIFLLAHVSGTGNWWGAVFFYLALMGGAYVYVMRNNVEHVKRERARVGQVAAAHSRPVAPDESKALDGLARHIHRQNVIALAPLVPFAVIVVCTQFSGFEKAGWSQILRIHAATSPALTVPLDDDEGG